MSHDNKQQSRGLEQFTLPQFFSDYLSQRFPLSNSNNNNESLSTKSSLSTKNSDPRLEFVYNFIITLKANVYDSDLLLFYHILFGTR